MGEGLRTGARGAVAVVLLATLTSNTQAFTTYSCHYTSNLTIDRVSGRSKAYFFLYARKAPPPSPPCSNCVPMGEFVELSIPFTTPIIDFISFQTMKTNATHQKGLDVWFTWNMDGFSEGLGLISDGVPYKKPRRVQFSTNNTGWGSWTLRASVTPIPVDQPLYIQAEWTMKPVLSNTSSPGGKGSGGICFGGKGEREGGARVPMYVVYTLAGTLLAVLVLGVAVGAVLFRDRKGGAGEGTADTPLLHRERRLVAAPLPKYTNASPPVLGSLNTTDSA